MTFSLTLNPAVAARAADDPDWHRRCIVRKVGTNIPMVIAYGCSEGRLHVHGAFAADVAQHERILAGLESAAGPWASPRGQAHQLLDKPMTNPDGWARYLMQNIAEAKEIDPDQAWSSMTNTTRRVAKQKHAEVRRQINGQPRTRRPAARIELHQAGGR